MKNAERNFPLTLTEFKQFGKDHNMQFHQFWATFGKVDRSKFRKFGINHKRQSFEKFIRFWRKGHGTREKLEKCKAPEYECTERIPTYGERTQAQDDDEVIQIIGETKKVWVILSDEGAI